MSTISATPQDLAWLENGQEINRDSISVTFLARHPSGQSVWVTRYDCSNLPTQLPDQLSELAQSIELVRSDGMVPLLYHYQVGTYFYAAYHAQSTYKPLLTFLKTTPPQTDVEWIELIRKLLGVALVVERVGLTHGTLSLVSIVMRNNTVAVMHTGLHALVLQASLPLIDQYDMAMFLAPELLVGDPIDGRCDVYSLGVMLYLLVTGQWPTPFTTSIASLKTNLSNGIFPIQYSHIPNIPSLTPLLKQCLELDAPRRPEKMTRLWSLFEEATFPHRPLNDPLLAEQSYQKPHHPIQQSRRRQWIVVGMVALIVLGMATYQWIVHYATGLSVATVPNIIGMSVEDAELLLGDQKMRLQVVGNQVSDTIPEGMIVDVKPAVGTQVKQNRIILVYKAIRQNKGMIPNWQGQTMVQATTASEELGLSLHIEAEAYSLTIPAGEIISQTITPNTHVSQNRSVGVVVSKGYPVEVLLTPMDATSVAVTIKTAVLEQWPSQTISIMYRSGAGATPLASKTLAPLETSEDTFTVTVGGDIEVYFNDRLAVRKRVNAPKSR